MLKNNLSGIILLLIISCTSRKTELFREDTVFFLFDTKINIIVVSEDPELADSVFQIAGNIFIHFDSLFNPDNNFLNHIKKNNMILNVWEEALFAHKLTHGAYDPTLGDVIKIWGDFSEGNIHIPDSAIICSMIYLRHNNFPLITPDLINIPLGMKPDLGGIAKGIAIQQIINEISNEKIIGILIEAGGDIVTTGQRENFSPWRIGIQHPRNTSDLIAIIKCSDRSVCTSGDYQRFVIIDNVRYHHILNPFDLKPSKEIVSSTVIYDDAGIADACATAFMVLPLEESFKLADSMGAEILLSVKNDRDELKFISTEGFTEFIETAYVNIEVYTLEN